MKRYTFFLLVNILFAVSGFSQLTCDEIIEKHLEATGLVNASEEIKQVIIDGEIQQGEVVLPLWVKVKLPDKLRTDIVYLKVEITKATNGKINWERNSRDDSVVVSGVDKQMAQDFVYRWTGGLYQYKDSTVETELMESTVDNFKLKVNINKGTRVYYIDKSSFLIAQIDDSETGNKKTYYKNYKKVGKYLLPHTMSGYEYDEPTINMKFNEVIFNVAIPDAVFEKPGQ